MCQFRPMYGETLLIEILLPLRVIDGFSAIYFMPSYHFDFS